MYNPQMQDSLNEILELLPKQLIAAMGFLGLANDLLSFVATYFYGFLILLLPMIFTIVAANRSVASHVDKGSMAYLLSTPNTRTKVVLTQAVYLIASITLIIGLVIIAGIAISQIAFPGELDIKGFIILNLGALLLYYALTGIGFLASCIFNDTKNSLMIGAGLPVAFLVLQMLSDVGESTEFLKYFTLYTLFDPAKITTGEGYGISFLVLGFIALAMYIAGIISFKKRDLPL
jgi:ABC-2 type transport system permease protein